MGAGSINLDGGFVGGKSKSEVGLTVEVIATKVYHVWVILCLYVFSIAVLLPSKPIIYTDFFATERAGYSVRCDGFAIGKEPAFCQDAHSDAVWWGSGCDFVSNSIVAFLLVPLIGRWSDRYGRRPFLALFLLIAMVPPLLMAAHVIFGLSLYFYFPAQALAGPNAILLLCTAYVTDLISPHNRASALALNMAAFASSFVVGPAIGGVTTTAVAAWLSVGGTFCTFFFMLIALNESLGSDAKAKAWEKQRQEGKWAKAPWQCLRILGRSRLATRLAVVASLAGFVALGFMEMLSQYLQIKLQYGTFDLAMLMIVAGVCGILVQAVLMRILMRFLGESYIIIFASVSRIVEQLVMCVATSKAAVVAAVVVGSFASLITPSTSSLLSKNTASFEQGAAQGAIFGMSALSQGCGPLLFAFLFSGFTRSDSSWTYFPGAPYLFGAFLMAICVGVACTIDRKAERGQSEDGFLTQGENKNSESVTYLAAATKSGELSTAGSQNLTQRPGVGLSSNSSLEP